jgi:N-acetylmuramoyl-L-alanine amidase
MTFNVRIQEVYNGFNLFTFTVTVMKLILSTLVAGLMLITPVRADEFNCLVEALYHEARSENMIPILAVANVILTRVAHSKFPDTICEVVHQGRYWNGHPIRDKCHFSYWCDGRDERYTDMAGLIKVINVAEMSLKGVLVKQTVGATHYHASYVTPQWASNPSFKPLGQLGTHLFYLDMSR